MKTRAMLCAAALLLSLPTLARAVSVEDTLRKLDAEWSAAAQSKNLDKAVSYYAEDGMVLPPQAPLASGKAAVREVWKGLLAIPGVDLTFVPTKIGVSKAKDLAYDVGTYTLKMNDANGNAVSQIGKYVVVWKKQANGEWKVQADIFNPDK